MKSQKERKDINPNFPNWYTANVILSQIVDEYTGIFINFPKNKYNNLSTLNIIFSFINPNALSLVPEEDRPKFLDITNEWHGKIWNESHWGFHKIVENYCNQPITKLLLLNMKNDIERSLLNYLHTRGTTFDDIKQSLRQVLGISGDFSNIKVEISFKDKIDEGNR